MDRLEYLSNQYENILGWYKQSEEKARFLVTINTFAAGIINGLVFIASDKVPKMGAMYTTPVWSLVFVSAVALIGSYILILRAVWARHRGWEPALKDTERFWFFGHVAAMTREEHQALVQNWSEERMEATMTAQNYILAHNVRTKFDALNWAISLTIVSLILLFVFGVAHALVAPKSF
jgi:hypothetical protein